MEEVWKLYKGPFLGMFAAQLPVWSPEDSAPAQRPAHTAESLPGTQGRAGLLEAGPARASASCIIDLLPGRGHE